MTYLVIVVESDCEIPFNNLIAYFGTLIVELISSKSIIEKQNPFQEI
ncbi:MAG: hypothetical protein HXY49_02980 [Ignavibacteriaceae bacterium]|nr:hypothetical protein [Ignavibacteriaceae bacterium]